MIHLGRYGLGGVLGALLAWGGAALITLLVLAINIAARMLFSKKN